MHPRPGGLAGHSAALIGSFDSCGTNRHDPRDARHIPDLGYAEIEGSEPSPGILYPSLTSASDCSTALVAPDGHESVSDSHRWVAIETCSVAARSVSDMAEKWWNPGAAHRAVATLTCIPTNRHPSSRCSSVPLHRVSNS